MPASRRVHASRASSDVEHRERHVEEHDVLQGPLAVIRIRALRRVEHERDREQALHPAGYRGRGRRSGLETHRVGFADPSRQGAVAPGAPPTPAPPPPPRGTAAAAGSTSSRPTEIGIRNGIVATAATGERRRDAAEEHGERRDEREAQHRRGDAQRRVVAQGADLLAVGDVDEQDRRGQHERAQQQPRAGTVAADDERPGGEGCAAGQRESRSHVRPIRVWTSGSTEIRLGSSGSPKRMTVPRPTRTATMIAAPSASTADDSSRPPPGELVSSATAYPVKRPLVPRKRPSLSVPAVRSKTPARSGVDARAEDVGGRRRRRVGQPQPRRQAHLALEGLDPGRRERPARRHERAQPALQALRQPDRVTGDEHAGVPAQLRADARRQRDVRGDVVAVTLAVQPGEQRLRALGEPGHDRRPEHARQAHRQAGGELVRAPVAVVVDRVAALPGHHRQDDEHLVARAVVDRERHRRGAGAAARGEEGDAGGRPRRLEPDDRAPRGAAAADGGARPADGPRVLLAARVGADRDAAPGAAGEQRRLRGDPPHRDPAAARQRAPVGQRGQPAARQRHRRPDVPGLVADLGDDEVRSGRDGASAVVRAVPGHDRRAVGDAGRRDLQRRARPHAEDQQTPGPRGSGQADPRGRAVRMRQQLRPGSGVGSDRQDARRRRRAVDAERLRDDHAAPLAAERHAHPVGAVRHGAPRRRRARPRRGSAAAGGRPPAGARTRARARRRPAR